MKIFFLLILLYINLSGFAIDRRELKTTYNSYFVYPLVLSMPGLGKAYGAGVMGNNLLQTDTDAMLLHMRGDFKLNIATLANIPLFEKNSHIFTLDLAYLRFQDGTIEAFERGRNSKVDDKFYFDTNEFSTYGAQLSAKLFDNQLEIYGGYSKAYVDPNSIRDKDDNNVANNIGDIDMSMYRYGIYLDDTDSRLDPRVGYRVQIERYGVKHEEKKFSDGYQNDISLTAFIPILSDRHIFVANYFQSSASITRVGIVDPADYTCDLADTTCIQAIYDEVRRRREIEVKKGNATSLGGTQRLRAYPHGRFYDTHTAFVGLEHRWYLFENWQPFDKYAFKGVHTGIQLAFFQEWGQVHEKNNHKLYEDMKSSTGIGVRFLFNTMTARLDLATGDEGEQITFFYGYSF
ncbi:MAG: hypothetical protein DRG11_07080 [Epsilonproteobacteria bacterium]|nr:MAG: hypothetical protein DRG11_07080 [Campylobacterota bacterium]